MFGTVYARPSPVQFQSPLTSLMGGIGAGQQMMARAQQLQQAKQMQPYMVQQAAAKVPYMQAQEQKWQQAANPLLAGTGGGITGARRAAMYAAQIWGENDPRTKQIEKSADIQEKAMQQRGAYYGSNVEEKYKTTTQKLLDAMNRTGDPKAKDILNQALLKSAQGAQQLKQNLWSQEAETYYNQITPLVGSLEKFGGLQGSMRQIKDKGLQYFGIKANDPDWSNVLLMQQKLPLLAKALGRSAGMQATDEATKTLMKTVSDPDKLKYLTPHQIGVLWNAVGDLVHAGATVAKGSIAKPPAVLGKAPVPGATTTTQTTQASAPAQTPQQGQMVTMIAPSGKTYSLSASQAQAALAQGWKHG